MAPSGNNIAIQKMSRSRFSPTKTCIEQNYLILPKLRDKKCIILILLLGISSNPARGPTFTCFAYSDDHIRNSLLSVCTYSLPNYESH